MTQQFTVSDPPPEIPPGQDPYPGIDYEEEERAPRCANCRGAHHIQVCPEIRAALFAPEPWSDPRLGKVLCQLRWKDHAYFVTLIRNLTPDHLVVYAASYQAFIRSHAPQSDLTISQIIQSWTREMQRGDDGPAALALRAA